MLSGPAPSSAAALYVICTQQGGAPPCGQPWLPLWPPRGTACQESLVLVRSHCLQLPLGSSKSLSFVLESSKSLANRVNPTWPRFPSSSLVLENDPDSPSCCSAYPQARTVPPPSWADTYSLIPAVVPR